MLPSCCNMIKAMIRAVRVALGLLIMTLLAKQFTAPQFLFILKVYIHYLISTRDLSFFYMAYYFNKANTEEFALISMYFY